MSARDRLGATAAGPARRSRRSASRRIVPLAGVLVYTLACGPDPRGPQVAEGLQPINGTELYIKRMGAGEPIDVVHGGPLLEHGY